MISRSVWPTEYYSVSNKSNPMHWLASLLWKLEWRCISKMSWGRTIDGSGGPVSISCLNRTRRIVFPSQQTTPSTPPSFTGRVPFALRARVCVLLERVAANVLVLTGNNPRCSKAKPCVLETHWGSSNHPPEVSEWSRVVCLPASLEERVVSCV